MDEVMFFDTELPGGAGRFDGGICGVVSSTLRSGEVRSYFHVSPFVRLRRDRVCELKLTDGTTLTVPISVVKRPEDLPGAR